MFEGFVESNNSYTPRAPILKGLSKIILLNIQSASEG